MTEIKSAKPLVSYFVLAAAVLALALAGFGLFLRYPAILMGSASLSGLYLVATVAGVGALFSPCSCPLLVTLLARNVDQGNHGMLWRVGSL